MQFKNGISVLVMAGVGFSSIPSLAQSRRTKAPETYAAVEQEDLQGMQSVENTASMKSKKTTLTQRKSQSRLRDKKPAPKKVAIASKSSHPVLSAQTAPEAGDGNDVLTKKGTFEQVDPAQRTGIARRLRLVERLIMEHGRAYDYRIHTNAELEMILRELDRASTVEARARREDVKATHSSEEEAAGKVATQDEDLPTPPESNGRKSPASPPEPETPTGPEIGVDAPEAGI